MRHYRYRIVTSVLTLLVTAGSWLGMHAARPERTSDLVRVSDWTPQTWSRLDGHGSNAECELPAGQRYRLVLGCLGDATQEYRVSLRLTGSPLSSRDRDKREAHAEVLDRHTSERTRPQILSSVPSIVRSASTNDFEPSSRNVANIRSKSAVANRSSILWSAVASKSDFVPAML